MDALLEKLAAHRRRIRLALALEAALRWTFLASLAACVCLAVSKLSGFSLQHVVVMTILLPPAMAVREWVRKFSLRDCAVHMDHLLGLEERLATAVEMPGAMGQLQSSDAVGALERAAIPPRSLPREAKLLVGSALLCAALVAIPVPDRSGAMGNPAFEAVLEEEAAKLESLAAMEVRFKEIAELAKEGRGEEALAALQALQEILERRLLEGGAEAGPETRNLLDQAAASASAISAELARLGRTVHAPPPTMAREKLERQRILSGSLSEGSSGGHTPGPAIALDRVDWSPKYHAVILRYFDGREP
jgi:hypothetical protein